ncbi:MAG: hypothetical protein ACYTF8_05170 [Planctomycetota bacterium]|jgi:Tol biopolymer transport system component
MKKTWLLLAALWFAGCDGDGFANQAGGIPEEVQAAIDQLLAAEPVAPDSELTVYGPVSPGTEMASLDSTVEVPPDAGDYVLVVIDEQPQLKMGHRHRLAWINTRTGTMEVEVGQFQPEIFDPLQPDEPLGNAVTFEIQGSTGRYFRGTTPVPVDVSHKPPIGAAVTQLQAIAQSASKPLKLASVSDFGDTKIGQFRAKAMASNADDMGKWIKAQGFELNRISQYSGNKHPRIPGKSKRARTYLQELDKFKERFAQAPTPPGEQQHEFFLYIASHGSKDANMSVYGADGSGLNRDFTNYLFMSDLAKKLAEFPDRVRITVFIDTCYAGNFFPKAKEADLHKRQAGMTIITTSDDDSPSANGVDFDSGTDDFLQGNGDLDGDGDSGDIRDRVKKMKQDDPVGFFDPMYDHWPAGTTWGCLEKTKKKTKVAFLGEQGGESAIYAVDPESGEDPERLTPVGTDVVRFTVAPDGSRLAFETNFDGADKIVLRGPEGSLVTIANGTQPDWGPGEQVAFIGDRDGSVQVVNVLDPSLEAFEIATGTGILGEPKISLRGEFAAYNEAIPVGARRANLKKAYTDGSGFKGIGGILYDFRGHSWTSNDELVVSAKDSPANEKNNSLYSLDPHTSISTKLLGAPAGVDYTKPVVSPDGTRIAFLKVVGFTFELMVLDLLTDTVQSYGPTNSTEFSWSPDGTDLAFTRETDGNSRLWFLNVDTGEQEPLSYPQLEVSYPRFMNGPGE